LNEIASEYNSNGKFLTRIKMYCNYCREFKRE